MANKQKARKKQQQQRRRQQKQQRRGRRGSPTGSSQPFDEATTTTCWIDLQKRICDKDEPGTQIAVSRLVRHRAGATAIASESLVDFLWEVWPGGWRPLEVVREIRRSQKAAHESLIAAVVLAQANSYQNQSIRGKAVFNDPAWEAELTQISESRSWTRLRVAHVVPDWMQWNGLDLKAAILVAAETAHSLTHLPTLDVLGSYPGGPVGSATGNEHLPPKIVDKVSALLRKAESTEYVEEADALTAKAQEIMTRYAFDHAVLAAEQAARIEKPGLRRVPVDNPHALGRAILLQQIAEATRCRSVWNKQLGLATIGGFSVDMDAVELLYGSLLVQATRAIVTHGSIKDSAGRSRTAAFRKSFMLSFAQRVGERLRADTEATTTDAASDYGDRLLPVLSSRNIAVDELWAKTQEPHLHRSEGAQARHVGGYAAGRFAADQANLSGRFESVAG